MPKKQQAFILVSMSQERQICFRRDTEAVLSVLETHPFYLDPQSQEQRDIYAILKTAIDQPLILNDSVCSKRRVPDPLYALLNLWPGDFCTVNAHFSRGLTEYAGTAKVTAIYLTPSKEIIFQLDTSSFLDWVYRLTVGTGFKYANGQLRQMGISHDHECSVDPDPSIRYRPLMYQELLQAVPVPEVICELIADYWTMHASFLMQKGVMCTDYCTQDLPWYINYKRE